MEGVHTHCIVKDLTDHPRCCHGPMLLFRKTFDSNNKLSQSFYACAANRDTKTKCSINRSDEVIRKNIVFDDSVNDQHIQRINNCAAEYRRYCHSCNKFFLTNEANAHRGEQHHVKIGIDDTLLRMPTTLLFPISDDKRLAQYFFSESTLKCISDLFKYNKLNKIICMGAPRLMEYLSFNYPSLQIKSILLDFDNRFRPFYKTNEFLWYNMFNNYFMDGEKAENIFEQFLIESNGERICLFTDPPFGCRTEMLVYTIKQISQKYQQINGFQKVLPVMWIFPYFMETYVKNDMPEMEMIDYKINYDNHKMYSDGEKSRKLGSPVRIFTNILMDSINLSKQIGYKYCAKCNRWTAIENKHCNRCKICPSKNGSTYIHCTLCAECVKPNYKHCTTCMRCTQAGGHNCIEYQKQISCWICRKKGHNERNCRDVSVLLKKRVNRYQKNTVEKICYICMKLRHNEKVCDKREKKY